MLLVHPPGICLPMHSVTPQEREFSVPCPLVLSAATCCAQVKRFAACPGAIWILCAGNDPLLPVSTDYAIHTLVLWKAAGSTLADQPAHNGRA